jgi:murein DD-endopeptidase MepM/ murein hydrolase activator NlpD
LTTGPDISENRVRGILRGRVEIHGRRCFPVIRNGWRRRITFMLVPHSEGRVYEISLPAFAVLALSVLLLGLFAAIVTTALVYRWESAMRAEEVRELAGYKESARRREEELRLVARELEELREKMGSLEALDRKIRELASVPTKSGGLSFMPVGGGSGGIVSEARELGREADDLASRLKELCEILERRIAEWASIPNRWPVEGWITSPFGYRGREFHEGVDIAASYGAFVRAAADGVVSFAGWRPGYGKLVVIDHSSGYSTVYAHNSRILVKEGQRVRKGDPIAAVGSTGYATGPHLHYEIRKDGVPLDPTQFLR